MILDKEVEVKWHNLTRLHYEGLGYEGYKFNKPLTVKVEHVSNGASGVYINVKCDCCEKIKKIRFNTYIASIQNNNLKFNQWYCIKCISRIKRGITKEELQNKIDKVHGIGHYTLIGEYVNYKTPIKVRHEECSHEWNVNPSNILKEGICPKCSKKIKDKTTQYFSKEINGLYNGEIEVLGEYYGNKNKILVKHVACGTEYNRTPNELLGGHLGCPKCKVYKGEKEIARLLETLNIKYISQLTLEGCRNIHVLPFDFAIFDDGDLHCLIEYDGKQHFEPVNFGGCSDDVALQSFNHTKNNDSIKNKYCEDNNIKLVRIPYWDFDNIEDILNKELHSLL